MPHHHHHHHLHHHHRHRWLRIRDVWFVGWPCLCAFDSSHLAPLTIAIASLHDYGFIAKTESLTVLSCTHLSYVCFRSCREAGPETHIRQVRTGCIVYT